MKKKIAVVLSTEPEWGGEHQYASVLMECLIEIASDDIELVAICESRYWKKWCREHNIQILNTSWLSLTEMEQKKHLKYPLLSRIECMNFTSLGKTIRMEKVNAIVATTQGLFIPNLNIKVIAPVQDLMHRYERKFPEVGSGYDARELLFSSKAKYAWCVLTDSMLGKKQFIESYSNYMRRKLPHIVSLPFVVPEHIFQCEEEPIEVPAKYVFYPAQFWKHKNHLNLIKALKLLIQEIPDIHLVLVGSEKNVMKELKHYIADNGLQNNITIKGFVSNENITYLYRNAVGLVMPSYFGPTNIPPLEAMALGCPVAVSNKYAMPEQVGDAGLLFDPDSPEEIAGCIEKMWLDDRLRQRMILGGYNRIKKWTKKEFMERLQKIIRRI